MGTHDFLSELWSFRGLPDLSLAEANIAYESAFSRGRTSRISASRNKRQVSTDACRYSEKRLNT